MSTTATSEQAPTADQPTLDLTLYVVETRPTIRTADDYREVAEGLRANKTWQAGVRAWFAPLKRKAHEVHGALCQRETQTLEPALIDERLRKAALEAYDAEQQRIAREQQAALEAEQRRQAAEQQRAEEARQLAEAAALETQANVTGDETLRAAAEEVLAAPVEIAQPAIVVEKSTPKVSGLSYTDKWEVPVDDAKRPVGVDLQALCAAVAKGDRPELAALVTLNLSAANAMFQASQGKVVIPGVPHRHRRVPRSGRG